MTNLTLTDAALAAAIAEQSRWLEQQERDEAVRAAEPLQPTALIELAAAASTVPIELAALTLADLLRLEDAVDAHRRGWTRQQHVDCYKPVERRPAIAAYIVAARLIAQAGTARKAAGAIARAIAAAGDGGDGSAGSDD